VAGLAAAVVLGVGAGAVAVTNMSAQNTPSDIMAATAKATEAPAIEPSDTPEPTKKPTKSPKPKPTNQEQVSNRSTPPPSEPERTPAETPTPTVAPTTPKPSTKPPTSKTPTPGPKKPVPSVVNLPYAQARTLIAQAGFKINPDDQTGGKTPEACLKVGESWPKGGELLEVGKSVKVVLIPNDPCGTPTPTGTVPATIKP